MEKINVLGTGAGITVKSVIAHVLLFKMMINIYL